MVPFRLTQNLVDAFGVSGYEGAYRRACEVTLQVCYMPPVPSFASDWPAYNNSLRCTAGLLVHCAHPVCSVVLLVLVLECGAACARFAGHM